MLKKFLSIVFLLIFCLADCNAKKVFVEAGRFLFVVESTTNTAMLANVKENGISHSISVPEFVKYNDEDCNVIIVSPDAFSHILGQVRSVNLPKFLIDHDYNSQTIENLLDKNIKVTKDDQKINKIEDFEPFPKLGKLGWEHEDQMHVETGTESDWCSLNRFMNGY